MNQEKYRSMMNLSQNSWSWKGLLEHNPCSSLLHNLCQCFVTWRVTKCFPMFSWTFLCSRLCPLALGSTKNSWFSPVHTLPLGIYGHWWDSTEPTLLPAEQFQNQSLISGFIFKRTSHINTVLLDTEGIYVYMYAHMSWFYDFWLSVFHITTSCSVLGVKEQML